MDPSIQNDIKYIYVDTIRSSLGGKDKDIRGIIDIPKNIISPYLKLDKNYIKTCE